MNDELPADPSKAGMNPPRDFTTFMRNYQDMVFSTSLRLLANPAQAEDISQEVFLKAWERWDMLSQSPAAGGWLKAVATNLSLNHLQRYRRRWRFFSEFADEGDDAPSVEFAAPEVFFEGMDAAERREWIERALAGLPEHQRVPLVLFHFEELSYDAIANRLGISLSKVKMDILRGRAALARALSSAQGAGEGLGT